MLTQHEFDGIMTFFEKRFAEHPNEFLNLKDLCRQYEAEHGLYQKLDEVQEELEKIFIKKRKHVEIDTFRRVNAIYRFRVFFPKKCHEEFKDRGIHVNENGKLQALEWSDTVYFGEPKSDNVIGYLEELSSTSLRARTIGEVAEGYKEWREAKLNLNTPIEVEPYLHWRIPQILEEVIKSRSLTDVLKVMMMMLTATSIPKEFRNQLNKNGYVITDEKERIVFFKDKDVELQQNYSELGLGSQQQSYPGGQPTEHLPEQPQTSPSSNHASIPEAKSCAPKVEKQGMSGTRINEDRSKSCDETSQEKPQEEEETYDRKKVMRLVFRIYNSLQYNSKIEESAKGVKEMYERAEDDQISMKAIINVLKESLEAAKDHFSLEELRNCTNSCMGDSVFLLFRQMAISLESPLSEEIIQQSNTLQTEKSTERILIPKLIGVLRCLFLELFALPAIRSKQNREQDRKQKIRQEEEKEEEETFDRKKTLGLIFNIYDSFPDNPDMEKDVKISKTYYEEAKEGERICAKSVIYAIKECVVVIKQCLSFSERNDSTNSYNGEVVFALFRQMANNLESSFSDDITQELITPQTEISNKRIMDFFLRGIMTTLNLELLNLPTISFKQDREQDCELKNQSKNENLEEEEEEETYDRKEAMRLLLQIYDSLPYDSKMEKEAKWLKKTKVKQGERISMNAILAALKRFLGIFEKHFRHLELVDFPNSYSSEVVLVLLTQMVKSLGYSSSEEVIQQLKTLRTEKSTERILIPKLMGVLKYLFLELFALPAIRSKQNRISYYTFLQQ